MYIKHYRSAFLMQLEAIKMQAAKQDALNTINQLHESANMEEIMYRLYVLDKVRKGQEAIQEGETLTSDELRQDIDSWWSGQSLLAQT